MGRFDSLELSDGNDDYAVGPGRAPQPTGEPIKDAQYFIDRVALFLLRVYETALLEYSRDRKSRVLAYEMMVMDLGSCYIIRDGELHKLYTQLEIGKQRGLCTKDSSLGELYEKGQIGCDTLISHAVYPDQFRQRYTRSGI